MVEQIFTRDNSGGTVGDQPPNSTLEWGAEAGEFALRNQSSPTNDRVVELEAPDGVARALSFDEMGTPGDVDMLGLVKHPSYTSSRAWCRLYARGANALAQKTGYFSSINYDTTTNEFTLRIGKYLNDDYVWFEETPIGDTANDYQLVRFNVVGDTIRARVWTFGTQEPDTWDLERTDSTNTLGSGWVGIGGYSGDVQSWDYVSVGVDGATPSLPTLSTLGADAFEVTTTAAATIGLDWDAPTLQPEVDSIDRYRIYRAQSSGSARADYTEVASTSTLGYDDSGLDNGIEYYYRIGADLVIDGTVYNSTLSAEVNTRTDLPGPVGLNITNIGVTEATFNWTANHTNDETRVEYQENEGDPWVTETTVAYDVESVTVTDLIPNEQYAARVVAQTPDTEQVDIDTPDGTTTTVAEDGTLTFAKPHRNAGTVSNQGTMRPDTNY